MRMPLQKLIFSTIGIWIGRKILSTKIVQIQTKLLRPQEEKLCGNDIGVSTRVPDSFDRVPVFCVSPRHSQSAFPPDRSPAPGRYYFSPLRPSVWRRWRRIDPGPASAGFWHRAPGAQRPRKSFPWTLLRSCRGAKSASESFRCMLLSFPVNSGIAENPTLQSYRGYFWRPPAESTWRKRRDDRLLSRLQTAAPLRSRYSPIGSSVRFPGRVHRSPP